MYSKYFACTDSDTDDILAAYRCIAPIVRDAFKNNEDEVSGQEQKTTPKSSRPCDYSGTFERPIELCFTYKAMLIYQVMREGDIYG